MASGLTVARSVHDDGVYSGLAVSFHDVGAESGPAVDVSLHDLCAASGAVGRSFQCVCCTSARSVHDRGINSLLGSHSVGADVASAVGDMLVKTTGAARVVGAGVPPLRGVGAAAAVVDGAAAVVDGAEDWPIAAIATTAAIARTSIVFG